MQLAGHLKIAMLVQFMLIGGVVGPFVGKCFLLVALAEQLFASSKKETALLCRVRSQHLSRTVQRAMHCPGQVCTLYGWSAHFRVEGTKTAVHVDGKAFQVEPQPGH
jgi:hypothetical protein